MRTRRGLLYIVSVFVLFASTSFAETKVISHRGFWKTENSAQNSLAALQKAADIGAYGSEFDVLMTKDNVMIINHDGRIKDMVIEETFYEELSSITLSNGERLPTLEEYLLLGKNNKKIKLILEIKSLSTPEKETQAVLNVINMVKKMGMEKQVEYIAFSLHVVKELIRLSPKTTVAYLNGDLSPQELKNIGCSGLDYHINVYKKHKNWIKEAHKLGLTTNVWTVNEQKDMEYFINEGIDYITTDEPLLLQQILFKN